MIIKSHLIARNGSKDTISYLMVKAAENYLYMGSPNPDPDNKVAAIKTPLDNVMKRGLMFPVGEWVPRPKTEDELKMEGVLFQGVMCSLTWKDQFGLHSIKGYVQAGMSINFEFANGNKLLLTPANLVAFESTWLPARMAFFPLPT